MSCFNYLFSARSFTSSGCAVDFY